MEENQSAKNLTYKYPILPEAILPHSIGLLTVPLKNNKGYSILKSPGNAAAASGDCVIKNAPNRIDKMMTPLIVPETGHLSLSAAGIEELINRQTAFFESGVTRSYAFRKSQLRVFKAALQRYEQQFIDALQQDLGRAAFESYGFEMAMVYECINNTSKRLKSWMQPQNLNTPFYLWPATSNIIREPLGKVLVIGPWNYPVNMLLTAVVEAMAAGNTVIIKPSEMAPATEAVVAKMIDETYEPDYIAVITGPGTALVPALIEPYRMDHIFFTGSKAVGKIILAAAAKNLSPVTLELGGKSPCIVTKHARIGYAAKKIVWGKFANAGQTCVAPDYLLVHQSVKDVLVRQMIIEIEKMYGPDPKTSPDYPRMVNDKRWQAVAAYLQNGSILYGGKTDRNEKYIGPTLLENVDANDPVMQEEIFGPVLPVISYQDDAEALQWIANNPTPLSLYLFSENTGEQKRFMETIPFGGGCINNCLMQVGNPNLSFGGVGTSGMGQYHGKAGFDTFTHPKSIITTTSWIGHNIWYAPFKNRIELLRKLIR